MGRYVASHLRRRVDKGRMSESDLEDTLARIRTTTDLGQAATDAEVVIEAIVEDLGVKRELFRSLEAILGEHAILASNTSSLSITEMGAATLRPDKVVGFHFFYPASMMRLIEVVEGDETSEETMQSAANFSQQIRKMPIRCGEMPHSAALLRSRLMAR